MKKKLSTTQLILLSFIAVILPGAVILSLPVSSASGKATPFIDALFTATTSTCVTGLVTVTTASHWSAFGHAVILILIQAGGLGVITVTSLFMVFLYKKMGLSERLLIQDAFNLNTLLGIMQFVKKVIYGTFIVEGIGALLYMTVFIPEFGLKGIWISVFNSVSAFCNAGIDIIGENSLAGFITNPLVNFVTISLIILGGIGYIVWWDIIGVLKNFKKRGLRCFDALSLHSKIALRTTLILILGGAAFFFIFEYNNTMQELSLTGKIQASLFQSVTTRTAGFYTIPQEELTTASSFITILLMFIGGSPAGTAGGVKTVTAALIFASAVASVKGRNQVVIADRTINEQAVRRAVAVILVSFATVFISSLLLSLFCRAETMDILFETFSAVATVGLSRNFTPELSKAGKLIIIISMYLGRVGPLTLALALNKKHETKNIITNPTEDISVG